MTDTTVGGYLARLRADRDKAVARAEQAEQGLRAVYAAARRALTGLGVDPDESPERVAALDGMAAGLDDLPEESLPAAARQLVYAVDIVLEHEEPRVGDLTLRKYAERLRGHLRVALTPAEVAQLAEQPAPADRSEVPTRAEVWQLLRDELRGRLSRLREGAPSTYVTDVAIETALNTLIERGWLRVRDDEGGPE